MKKLFKIFGYALLFTSLCLTGCKLNPDDPNNNQNNENENGNGENGESKGPAQTLQLLKFASGGAKALGIVDQDDIGRHAAARSAETDALIVKILEDGSFESFMSIPEGSSADIAPISYIAQSPNPESHEIYIVFKYNSYISTPVEVEEEWGTWTDWKNITIGQLLCVHEDGTYDDILMQEDGSWKWLYGSDKDSIAFDNLGNIYYLFQESSGNSYTNMIYKYDPKTKTSTQLTPAVENTYYEKFQVSGDGNWIFAKASRWNSTSSVSYLRAIPVSNPTESIELFYNSGTGGWINDWIYDDDVKAVYYNLSGTLYRIPEKDGTFSKDNRELLFTGDSSSWFEYASGENPLFVWKDGNGSYVYEAQTTWYTPDGEYPAYNENGESENTSRSTTYNYKNYYFRNPLTEEQEIDENVVLDFIVDQAYTSFSSNVAKSQVNAVVQKDKTTGNYVYKSKLLDSYDIRFDIFANDIGFEMLANATAGKTNLEALKAISSNGLVGLFCDLLTSDSSPYKKSGAGYYDMYDRNFYADILYVKDTDQRIDKSLFRMATENPEKFDIMGFYGWNLFRWSNSSNSDYTWNNEYTTEKTVTVGTDPVVKKVVDAEKVLKKLATYCTVKEIDFKLSAFKDDPKYGSLYTDKTNEEAVEFLDNPARIKILIQYMNDMYDNNNGNGKFLYVTCFKKDTDETAYAWKDSNANSIWWGNVGNFTTSYKKSLYGSYDNSIVEIVDEDGNAKGQYIDVGDAELKVVNTIIGEDGFFFLNALMDSSNEETGKHQVYYYDVATKEIVNLFQNVPDKDNLEVTTFSAGGNYIYFSAVKGFDILTAKIDVTTYQYSLLGSEQKLSQIIVVK